MSDGVLSLTGLNFDDGIIVPDILGAAVQGLTVSDCYADVANRNGSDESLGRGSERQCPAYHSLAS